jgi:hypothetical protein
VAVPPTIVWGRRRSALPATLRDRAAQADLERRGYAVFPQFAADDVDALRAVFAELHADRPPPYLPGSGLAWHHDPSPGPDFTNDLELSFAFRDELERRLAPFWDRYVPALYVDHRPVVSTFLIKYPGEEGHLPLHQDPTFLDERRHRATTMWVAIDDADSDLDNGPLHVLDGSHRVADEVRGTNTPSTFLQFLEHAWGQTRPLRHRAGDVIVMDARLVHGSPPNRSDRLRLAVCTPMVPTGVPLVHALGTDEGRKVALVPVPDDFYRRTSPGRLHRDPPEVLAGSTLRPRAPRPFRPGRLVTT